MYGCGRWCQFSKHASLAFCFLIGPRFLEGSFFVSLSCGSLEATSTCFKMAATARPYLLLLVVFGAVFCKDKDDESCRTYAGGQVYPQEVKTGLDHALHWSKALSEYDFCIIQAQETANEIPTVCDVSTNFSHS